MAAAVVTIVGLRALARDLKRATDPRAGELLKYMQQAGRQAASPVAERVRGDVPHLDGALAGTVRISSTRSGAAIRMGGISGVAYAGPVDFGGWPEGRPYIANGRYMFPAAQGLSSTVLRLYSDAIQTGLDHFSWTNPGDTAHD